MYTFFFFLQNKEFFIGEMGFVFLIYFIFYLFKHFSFNCFLLLFAPTWD